MAKVQGLFVGYRKFAVDRDWLRQQEEQRYRDRQRQFDEWSEMGHCNQAQRDSFMD